MGLPYLDLYFTQEYKDQLLKLLTSLFCGWLVGWSVGRSVGKLFVRNIIVKVSVFEDGNLFDNVGRFYSVKN